MAERPNTTDSCFRVSGLPSSLTDFDVTAEVLAKIIKTPKDNIEVHSLGHKPRASVRSYAGATVRPAGSKIATVSFDTLPDRLHKVKNLVLRHNFTHFDDGTDEGLSGTISITIDTHFLGFTPLNDAGDGEDHEIDCIVVSGLASHPFGSWKARGDRWMWVRDTDEWRVAGVRVLLYGYDSDLVTGDSFQSVGDIGKQLGQSLANIRSFRKDHIDFEPRPIVFIAHSLGGLVVKEAIVHLWRSLNEGDRLTARCIYGLIFFGVPHRGIRTDQWLPIINAQTNEELVKSLKPDSGYLRNLGESFDQSLRDSASHSGLKVLSICETKATRRKREITAEEEAVALLTRDSAESPFYNKPANVEQDCLKFNLDHSTLVKFTGPHDPHLDALTNWLHGGGQFWHGAVEIVQKRFTNRKESPSMPGLPLLSAAAMSRGHEQRGSGAPLTYDRESSIHRMSSTPKIDGGTNGELLGPHFGLKSRSSSALDFQRLETTNSIERPRSSLADKATLSHAFHDNLRGSAVTLVSAQSDIQQPHAASFVGSSSSSHEDIESRHTAADIDGMVKDIRSGDSPAVRHFAEHNSIGGSVTDLLSHGARPGEHDLLAARTQGHDGSLVNMIQETDTLTKSICDDNDGELFNAIKAGDCPLVASIIHPDAMALHHKDSQGRTPVFVAVLQGSTELVRMLLAAGAEMSEKQPHEFANIDEKSWTPLQAAVMNGNVEIVKLLVENGAELVTTSSGIGVLWLAVHFNIPEMVRYLARLDKVQIEEYRAICFTDYTIQGSSRWHSATTILHPVPPLSSQHCSHCITQFSSYDVKASLMASGSVDGTPLIYACWNGFSNVVRILLEAGAIVKECYGPLKRGPLDFAALSGDCETVEALLVARAQDRYGKMGFWGKEFKTTPIHDAAARGCIDVLRTLLNHEDFKPSKGVLWAKSTGTPLHHAAKAGQLEAVHMLLDAGAAIDAAMYDWSAERTPLMLAIQYNCGEVARALVFRGAKLNNCIKDAASEGSAESVKLALELGADIHQRYVNTEWPLHCATRQRDVEKVRILLDAGADPTTRGDFIMFPNSSPFHFAKAWRLTEITEMMQTSIDSKRADRKKKKETADSTATKKWYKLRGESST